METVLPKRSSIHLTKRVIDKVGSGQFVWDSQLPGFGVRVTAAGSRSFILQYRCRNGSQGRLTLASCSALTVEEARDLARKQVAIIANGGDPSEERRASRAEPTLKDRAEHYLTDYAVSKALKPRTVHDARHVLEKHAFPSLGHRKVSDIMPDDIERVHGRARQAVGPYQANRLLAVLSRIFALCVRAQLRTTNSCKGIVKFPEDQRWRNFSEDEVGRLLLACSRYPNQNAASAVRLLLFTGARLQEVVKAEWCQFDLESGVWEKPSSHTKTKRQHRLNLDGPALTLVRMMRASDPTGRYLFPGKDKRDPSSQNADPRRPRSDLKSVWSWIVSDAGLQDARPHDLRRTMASFMLDGQASLDIIGKTLGHTQVATTARYAQLRQSTQSEAMRKAGERMLASLNVSAA